MAPTPQEIGAFNQAFARRRETEGVSLMGFCREWGLEYQKFARGRYPNRTEREVIDIAYPGLDADIEAILEAKRELSATAQRVVDSVFERRPAAAEPSDSIPKPEA